ncbi:serine--tRNA ligase [Candidatus Curtissbacteria bacterium RIFCSPHIGHO2_01_FULL_41_11]|uniref:Serine--tRNA ligase n=1 Tax=Candidatus Curtissbacteria bacterium RIFCSPHIGHO2_01_FULL_41_11 TaxID=1797711 RepID=A0A1F5G3P1_9BACT|nr:MAG: serine--tRNA ligase [Candidatus Curtissbacteria bacterium RIFCSPHIGHO2_01_FULL_41_11]
MLDIKFIRENANLVEEKARQKGYVVSLEKLLNVDNKRRKLVNEVDKLRADRKKAAESREDKTGSDIKAKLKQKEDELEKLNEEFYQLIREVPNLPKKDVKVGKDESENEVIRKVGELPKFDFEPKDHLELGSGLDILDIERASKVSGSRFFYLKNELVALEFALVKFALEILAQEDFIQVIPPVLINKKVAGGLGYPEYETGEGYKVDDQYLVGTAEHSIVPMHMDETFAESDLPRRYVAFSTAFRREAGSYGKDTKGIIRVHQFDKVEMVSFVLPQDEDKEHEFLLSLEEKMMKKLNLPYQVVKQCTGDLGFPTARKYDIETWIPSQNKYRETHSASTNSDFQSRRLNIKYQKGASKEFVYILNATAIAMPRILIAIMENNQQKDGSIIIPKVLQKDTGFGKIPS